MTRKRLLFANSLHTITFSKTIVCMHTGTGVKIVNDFLCKHVIRVVYEYYDIYWYNNMYSINTKKRRKTSRDNGVIVIIMTITMIIKTPRIFILSAGRGGGGRKVLFCERVFRVVGGRLQCAVNGV